MRSILHKENPQLKNTEISTILSQRWKALTEEEKKPFVEQELIEREKYHQNMKEYREKMVHEKPVPQPGNQINSQQGSAIATYSIDDSLSSSIDYNANNIPYAIFQAISAPYSMYPTSSMNTSSTKSNSTSSSSMTPLSAEYQMMNYQGYNMLPNCPYPPIYPYPVPCTNNNAMNTNNTPYLMNPELMMNEEYIPNVMFANPLDDNQSVTSSTTSRSIHSHGTYYTANNTQTPMSQQLPLQSEENEEEDANDYNVIAMNIVQAVRHAGILP